jgi:hypothetical protein
MGVEDKDGEGGGGGGRFGKPDLRLMSMISRLPAARLRAERVGTKQVGNFADGSDLPGS